MAGKRPSSQDNKTRIAAMTTKQTTRPHIKTNNLAASTYVLGLPDLTSPGRDEAVPRSWPTPWYNVVGSLSCPTPTDVKIEVPRSCDKVEPLTALLQTPLPDHHPAVARVYVDTYSALVLLGSGICAEGKKKIDHNSRSSRRASAVPPVPHVPFSGGVLGLG